MNFKKSFLLLFLCSLYLSCTAQKPVVQNTSVRQTINPMTPEMLWKVKRVSYVGLAKEGNDVIFKVSTPEMEKNTFSNKYFSIPLTGGEPIEISDFQTRIPDKNISPDNKYKIIDKSVKIEKVHGFDYYPELTKSTAQIYTQLDYRHWDTWNDGTFNHIFFGPVKTPDSLFRDIMHQEPFNCPQKPFGGDEDYIWSPDGKSIIYVSKKLHGTAAVQSTNTDLFEYNLNTGKTKNLTESNKGYDTNPSFSTQGNLAFLSMQTDGYEADKNDIKVLSNGVVTNLTAHWDESVMSFQWAPDGKSLYFIAATQGTLQLFEVDNPATGNKLATVRQLTKGDFDVQSIHNQSGDLLLVSRTSFNRAAELFTYNLRSKDWKQLTNVNGSLYDLVGQCKTERRYVTTTDQKSMLVWVVYPPDFNPAKKYPTLLYCQGGPQSALTQFYSFRWNLHLMASQGYIVVAPNRRGMPGHGVEWNHQISKDWGGQNIRDYLSAIDDIAKEPYVDKSRLGAVGASYGGYSVFYLAGVHQKRFKTFIAHDGSFNLYSMYGSTEEMFFVNYDFGGPYWEDKNIKTYTEFNPIHHVSKWDTPIFIIQGGKDYRIPLEQGLEAFNAAQLKGLKSKLLYLPDENHWVMKPQNSLVWQNEFFKWLKETL